MELRKFDYQKEDVIKSKEVWVFRENEKHIEGIEVNLLSTDDSESLTSLLRDKILVENEEDKDFKIAMKPYMKAWRKFLKEKIVVKEEKDAE